METRKKINSKSRSVLLTSSTISLISSIDSTLSKICDLEGSDYKIEYDNQDKTITVEFEVFNEGLTLMGNLLSLIEDKEYSLVHLDLKYILVITL